MVFKAEQAGVMTEMARDTIRQIMAAGLDVRVYFSCSKEEIFCEMRASVDRLMEYADQVLCPRRNVGHRHRSKTFFYVDACARY